MACHPSSRITFALLPLCLAPMLWSQAPAAPADEKPLARQLPTDPKADKAYHEGLDLERKEQWLYALDGFKKADKIAGNKCGACATKIVDTAIRTGDFKLADQAAQELIALASTPAQQAEAHTARLRMLFNEGRAKKKAECYADGAREADAVLTLKPNDPHALYMKGMCLASEEKDDDARKTFTALEGVTQPGSVDYDRFARYIQRPELARARLAPAFRVKTIDGKLVSMDELHNKVVLIDFWATWCGPCKEALPGLKKIAQKFQGEPFIVISVSLDDDETKWKDFVAKNNMDWVQYRDGGWNGMMSRLFQVRAIPHTFTIDADGVLQDERIGDDGIDGKIKKLIAQAKKRMEVAPAVPIAGDAQ